MGTLMSVSSHKEMSDPINSTNGPDLTQRGRVTIVPSYPLTDVTGYYEGVGYHYLLVSLDSWWSQTQYSGPIYAID